jgi:hypothetical protein
MNPALSVRHAHETALVGARAQLAADQRDQIQDLVGDLPYLLAQLGISSSGYCAWAKRQPSHRAPSDVSGAMSLPRLKK